MQYSLTLDLVKMSEWELNPSQGCLVSFLTQAAAWAQPIIIDGAVWYWCSKSKILNELAAVFNTKDTIYRNVKILQEKGIIHYKKLNDMDLFCLTEKGKQWLKKDAFLDLGKKSEGSEKNPTPRKNIRANSEKNPSDLGKKSDISYNHISYNQDHTPLTPQGAQAGDFEKILDVYTTTPAGCVSGRGSNVEQAKREFNKISDVTATELVEIIRTFWQNDDSWRRGYQPSLARFLSEKLYKTQPQAARQAPSKPAAPRSAAYLTHEEQAARQADDEARQQRQTAARNAAFEAEWGVENIKNRFGEILKRTFMAANDYRNTVAKTNPEIAAILSAQGMMLGQEGWLNA